MGEARILAPQPFLIPAGVALGTEEVGAHVVVEAVHRPPEVMEVRDHLRADQPVRAGNEQLLGLQLMLPLGDVIGSGGKGGRQALGQAFAHVVHVRASQARKSRQVDPAGGDALGDRKALATNEFAVRRQGMHRVHDRPSFDLPRTRDAQ